jgi:hypothetical protein
LDLTIIEIKEYKDNIGNKYIDLYENILKYFKHNEN